MWLIYNSTNANSKFNSTQPDNVIEDLSETSEVQVQEQEQMQERMQDQVQDQEQMQDQVPETTGELIPPQVVEAEAEEVDDGRPQLGPIKKTYVIIREAEEFRVIPDIAKLNEKKSFSLESNR